MQESSSAGFHTGFVSHTSQFPHLYDSNCSTDFLGFGGGLNEQMHIKPITQSLVQGKDS